MSRKMYAMTNEKIKVLFLFGGSSSEHQVSLLSILNVMQALDREKFIPILVGIDLDGNWHTGELDELVKSQDNPALISLNTSCNSVEIRKNANSKACLFDLASEQSFDFDVVFPVMHGTGVEDGKLQGYLQTLGIKFVGCDTTTSAVCMDKELCKRVLRDAGIPVVDFLVVHSYQKDKLDLEDILRRSGGIWPLFVKPANNGSSVGCGKANDYIELQIAIDKAFEHDSKILIEPCLTAREIEVAVLGNSDNTIVSVPGEIVVKSEFYSYESKYLDEGSSYPNIPADLDEETTERIRNYSRTAYQIIGCQGLSRVDFFYEQATDKIYLNEINTLPGFTSISMYPKLMEQNGITYTDLITRLIDLALQS